jgi:hypothetical protein
MRAIYIEKRIEGIPMITVRVLDCAGNFVAEHTCWSIQGAKTWLLEWVRQ